MSLRFSTKGIYGIRALSRLVEQFGNGPLPLKTIAEEEKIPLRYLEQLMGRLRQSGIVTSLRGPGGGYRLTRAPEDIHLAEIVKTLEGSISLVRCLEDNYHTLCNHENNCTSRIVCMKLNQMIDQFLSNVTLSEITDESWQGKAIQIQLTEQIES